MNRTKNNFGLTEYDFEQLLVGLKKGDTTLFEDIFFRHFEECLNYLKNRYRAQHDDAYDATMDTLIEFRQRLVDGKVSYGNMRFLFTQMASQQYLRRIRSNKFSPISELGREEEGIEAMFDDDDLIKLRQAWKLLTPECQQLFKMNFHQGMKLVEVAQTLNRSAETIRKQKERCKKKLIQYFNDQTA